MPKEVLFIASPGEVAREVDIFCKLARLMTKPNCEVSYVDGMAAQDVTATPQQQADLIAARIAGRDAHTDFSLVTHGRGALSAVDLLRRNGLGDMSMRAFLLDPPLPNQGSADDHDFYDGLEDLSDHGMVKVIGSGSPDLWQQRQPAIAPEALVAMPEMSDLTNAAPGTIRGIYSLILH